MIAPARQQTVRCAIYTRKSVTEGLDQDFNSLDAQREAAEAFIKSQQHEGWVSDETRYDDGGFSGGDTDRPALQRLLKDIKSGLINCVVVYKVDRLSRSLLDFAQMVDVFDKYEVSFVSVTQQFNTNSSMGRLTLNVLLSFAQFEREVIGERTRDKMSAARRKGKWVGGTPFLGFDVVDKKLIINEREAQKVRKLFDIYLETQSLAEAVKEADKRQIQTKEWVTQKGIRKGGKRYSKSTLHGLLVNYAYIGKIFYENKVYEGEHDEIVDEQVFHRVQTLLNANNQNPTKTRNKSNALLKGILHCECGSLMCHTHTKKKNGAVYRYYSCLRKIKEGRNACDCQAIPAGEAEEFVVDQIAALGNDPVLQKQVLNQFMDKQQDACATLLKQKKGLARDMARLDRAMQQAIERKEPSSKLVLLEEQLRETKLARIKIETEFDELSNNALEHPEILHAIQSFYPIWQTLKHAERIRLFALLIEKITFSDSDGTFDISYQDSGIHSLRRYTANTSSFEKQ